MVNHATVADASEVSFYESKSRWGIGLFSWIFSTDKKRIGMMYMVMMRVFLKVGM